MSSAAATQSPPAPPRGAYAALLVVQVLFGVHPVANKLAFPAFGPGGVMLARVVLAAVVFQVLASARREPLPDARTHLQLAVASFFGVAANQMLFTYGLARTTAMHASVLITTVPVATLAVALASRRERATPLRVAGILVALAGALLVVGGRDTLGPAGGELVGDLMVLANSLSYAVYLVLSRDLLGRLSPWAMAAWMFTWGVPMVALVTGVPDYGGASASAWAALAFVGFGSTVGTYLLNLLALRHLPASVVAVFVCLQPLVATALAVPLLGEGIDGRTVFAAVVTVAGMVLATR